MGQLEGGAAADAHARGEALDDRALAGADEGGRVGAVAVGLEVDGEDEADAGLLLAGREALDEDEAFARARRAGPRAR